MGHTYTKKIIHCLSEIQIELSILFHFVLFCFSKSGSLTREQGSNCIWLEPGGFPGMWQERPEKAGSWRVWNARLRNRAFTLWPLGRPLHAGLVQGNKTQPLPFGVHSQWSKTSLGPEQGAVTETHRSPETWHQQEVLQGSEEERHIWLGNQGGFLEEGAGNLAQEKRFPICCCPLV